mmetsp:Transcript_49440/g.119955  ORF Transcript_49440/g.119955 Transcript_49440/m.119955 type:complete len:459 (+) Transcript_49440:48-1424(+)
MSASGTRRHLSFESSSSASSASSSSSSSSSELGLSIFSSRRGRLAMVAAGVVPLVAATAFVFWGQGRGGGTVGGNMSMLDADTNAGVNDISSESTSTDKSSSSGGGTVDTSTIFSLNEIARTSKTPADRYYSKHQEIPLPPTVHTKLPDLVNKSQSDQNTEEGKNIFLIGDVHGCYDEMLELHQKAVKEENDGIPFKYVIMVGDLVNKGPKSAEVVRHVRSNPTWFSVRGNHDDGALAAALGDSKRQQKKKYSWVLDGIQNDSTQLDSSSSKTILSDADVQWMSELPYTIEIPASMLREEILAGSSGSSGGGGDDKDDDIMDTLIVHAGVVPDVNIEQQEIEAMITMRELDVKCDKHAEFKKFSWYEKKKDAFVATGPSDKDGIKCDVPVAWASIYSPYYHNKRVVFGHNARRGLQLYDGHFAIGLDTGAVYGRGMTGMILPERKLVTIETKEHSSTR